MRHSPSWSGGITQWVVENTCYISVAFTWNIPKARERVLNAKALGLDVRVGGPAFFLPSMQKLITDVAQLDLHYPDAVSFHNPNATFASRGCPVGCYFCIVPKMEGKTFTLIPDFPVRTVLCDNNLSALPADFQDHIVGRYKQAGVPLLDANSGFEPATFTEDVYARWKPINKGPWRFAFDEDKERADVVRVMQMLRSENQKKKRVYVLIGNEPFAVCMDRIKTVIAHGCEPHVQPYIKLNAVKKEPFVQHDWTMQTLKDVARWANGWVWKKVPFEQYDRHIRKDRKA